MSWSKEAKIEIKDILEAGTCPHGHKVGDIFSYPTGRGKICAAAMHVLYPYILGLQTGGSFPWEEEKDSVTLCCPDYKNPVVFKITRRENSG